MPRVLVYGEQDLNLVDGSSVWQASVVEVLAAVFPAQPESSSGPRSWGGDGWGEYHLETELSQGMLLFDTDVYRLSFKDGLVYLAAGTTCQPERRARLACPDKYWLNGTMVPNWEEVQRTNF